ncbi:YcbK family protein [Desulfosediminicola sp.]|uniref:YcbK family protein n=1 Tax=Desulfosediminicola sp. TaxID=2886825 RepID=UPI003AF2ABFB
MIPPQPDAQLCRRRFIATAAKLTICAGLARPLNLHAVPVPSHKLKFYHIHTREKFELSDPFLDAQEDRKQDLNSFLRDFRTGEVHPIDFRLMKVLANIQEKTGSNGTYEVIGGYRSGATNEQLRANSNGVALKSLHLVGQAIDLRLTDLPTRDLRDVAISLRAGGVGYYPDSNFVHIDTGRIRYW